MQDSEFEQVRQWRRQLHRFPEIGWTEFVTTATIITALRQMDLNVIAGPGILNRTSILGRDPKLVETALQTARNKGVDPALLKEMDGLTGCMMELDTGKPGQVFGFRFDIDCVYVQESGSPTHQPQLNGFASCRPGLMHACAHDGHAAIGLGLAAWLSANRHKLSGKYRILFQPAEEGVRGARPVCDSGVIDDMDYLMSLHLGCNLAHGEVTLDPRDFLCTTKLDVRFSGKPAHAGADPEKGHNALAGACMAVSQILAAPRHSQGMSRVNVGVLKAGEGRNVVPSSAEMELEVRGENAEITQYLTDYVTRCAEGACAVHQLESEIIKTGEAVDFRNDSELISLFEEIIDQTPDLSCSETSLGGSEDASLLIRHVQQRGGKAIYMLVGADQPAGHHQANFDINEESMLTALRLLTAGIRKLQPC